MARSRLVSDIHSERWAGGSGDRGDGLSSTDTIRSTLKPHARFAGKLHLILGGIARTKSGERRIEHHGDAVENELSLHASAVFAATLLEFPT